MPEPLQTADPMNALHPSSTEKKPRLTAKIAVSAVILLILCQGFNGLLITLSLEKLYTDSLVSSYRILAEDLRRNLEGALRYGKPIEKFVGMNSLLENTLSYMWRQSAGASPQAGPAGYAPESGDQYVVVAMPDGTILYSTHPGHVGQKLPLQSSLSENSENTVPPPGFAKHGSTFIITEPLRDRSRSWAATVVIGFDDRPVRTLLQSVTERGVRVGVSTLTAGIILLLLFANLLLSGWSGEAFFPKRKVSTAVFLVVCLCQIVFSSFATNTFKNYYVRINKEKARTLMALMKEDIEYLLSKGMRIDKLYKMDVNMGRILDASPEIHAIYVMDENKEPLYIADPNGVANFNQPDFGAKAQPISRQLSHASPYRVLLRIQIEGDTVGYISALISENVISGKLQEIALDSATVVVISILFTAELLMMLFLILANPRQPAAGEPVRVNFAVIRPAAFLVLLGIDASISFLPLHMERLYTPMLGLSKDIVLGLPISTEMFFAATAIILSGAWLDRRGWKEPFLCGLLLSGLGTLYSWLAPDSVQFIISRGVVGLGYGLFWMACQGFVLSNAGAGKKVQGLAVLFAGIYAGNICGSAAGALLAERIGYSRIFLFGAVVTFLAAAYSLIFIRRTEGGKPEEPVREGLHGGPSFRSFTKYLTNPSVLGLILLSSIPSSLAVIGFLHYFSPLYLHRIGATQSGIGRIFMIYGICLILIAPTIGKFVDAAASKKKFIVIGGLTGSLGLIVFQLFGGYIAVVATVLLLGISGSFDASRNAYALNLRVTHELGVGKAIGTLSMGGRIGQVIGPITLGWLIVSVGANRATTLLGLVYLLATIVFVLITRSDRSADTVGRPEKRRIT